jgi:hypothetical protein
MFGSARGGSHKKCWDTLCRTSVFASRVIWRSHSAFWCIQGVKHQHTIFHSRVGPMRFSQEVRRDTLRRTCGFAFCVIWRSRSAIWCVRRCEMSTHYFSFSSGPGAGPTRSAPGHVMLNLCFCIPYDLEVT